MCEICFIRRKSESTESVADFVTTAGAVGNGTQDLRTRHAVSDNKRKSGLGMPSPYIPERKQILIPIYRPFTGHNLASMQWIPHVFAWFSHQKYPVLPPKE